MASQKKENILFVTLLMAVVATLPEVTSENIDCKGKAFYCVNSTHFKICVDLGGGVSTTVDDFLIPCPINTACKDDNYFECEYQLTTTLAPIKLSDATNEVVEASINTLENFEVNTLHPVNNNLNKLEELITNQHSTLTTAEFSSTVVPINIKNESFTSWDITTEFVNLNGASDFINTSSSDIKSENVAVSSTQDLSFGFSTKIDDLSITSEKVILINNVANDLFLENVSSSQDYLHQTENYVTESYNLSMLTNSNVINSTHHEIGDLNGTNISSHVENSVDDLVSDNLNTEYTEVPPTTISDLSEPLITTNTNYANTELITSLNTDSSNLAINDFESQQSSVVTIKSINNMNGIGITTFTNTEKYVDQKTPQIISHTTDIFKFVTSADVNSLNPEQASSDAVYSYIAQIDKELPSSRNIKLTDKITTELYKDDISNLISTEKLPTSFYTHAIEPAYTVDTISAGSEQTTTLKSLDSSILESIDFKLYPSSERTHIDDITTYVFKKDFSADVITEKNPEKTRLESTTTSYPFELISTIDPYSNLASTLESIYLKTQQVSENRLIDDSTTNVYKSEDIKTVDTEGFDIESTPILGNVESLILRSNDLKENENMHFDKSRTNLYTTEDLMVSETSTKSFDTVNTTIINETEISENIKKIFEPTTSVKETFEIHNTIERVNFQGKLTNNSEAEILQSTENVLAQVLFEQSSNKTNNRNVTDGLRLSEINIFLHSKDDSSKNKTIELNTFPNSLLKNGSLNITHIDLGTTNSEIENVKQDLFQLSTNNPLTSNASLENESETIKILLKNINSNYSTSSNILPIMSEIPIETNFFSIINNTDNENKLANNVTKIDYLHEIINGTSTFESKMQEELPLSSIVTESYRTTSNIEISNISSFILEPSEIIEISENSTKGRTDVHSLKNENVNLLPLHKINVVLTNDVADFVVTPIEFNYDEAVTTKQLTNTENIELVNGVQSDQNISIRPPNLNQEIRNLENTVSLASGNKTFFISFSKLNVSDNVRFSSDQLFNDNLSSTNNEFASKENITTTTRSANLNLASDLSVDTLYNVNVQNYSNEFIRSKESLNNLTDRSVINYDSESYPNITTDLISNENVVVSKHINTEGNQPTSIVYSLNINVTSNKGNQSLNTDDDEQIIESEHIDIQPQFTVIGEDTNVDKETNAYLRNVNDTQANLQDSTDNAVIILNDASSANNKNNVKVQSLNSGESKNFEVGISRSSSTNDKSTQYIQIIKTIAPIVPSKVIITDTTTNLEYLTSSPTTNLVENDFNTTNIKKNLKENPNENQISTVNISSKDNLVSQNISYNSDSIQKLPNNNELLYDHKIYANRNMNNNKIQIQLSNYTEISHNKAKSKNDLLGSSNSKTYLDVNNKQTIQTSTVKSRSNKTVSSTYSFDMRPQMQFSCASRPRGRYSDENNCNKFYICIGKEEPIVGTCPVDTVFSEINKQCTRNLSHCIRNNQFKCLSSGRFIDILSDEFYYICVRNQDGYVRYKLHCQKGYHLNKENIKCTINSASYEESSKNSSDKSTNEKKSSELTQSSNNENKFECVKEGKYEFPDDCRKYYVCIKNNSEFRRKIKKCDSDEVFNNNKRKCVDADSYEC